MRKENLLSKEEIKRQQDSAFNACFVFMFLKVGFWFIVLTIIHFFQTL